VSRDLRKDINATKRGNKPKLMLEFLLVYS